MKILIMEDEKLLKPPLPEALVILDVTAPGINSRQVAEEVETCIHSLLHRQEEETEALSFGNTSLELSTGMLRCGMSMCSCRQRNLRSCVSCSSRDGRIFPRRRFSRRSGDTIRTQWKTTWRSMWDS